MKKVQNILWGIVFVVLGAILTMNALGVTNINIFFEGWWTLFIIIPSLIGLLSEREKGGNLIMLAIGIVLLLGCRQVIEFEVIVKLILPVALIIIGIVCICSGLFKKDLNKEIQKINKASKNINGCVAVFSGQDVKYNNEEFKGLSIKAIFGGVDCDLRNAVINEDQVINAVTIFGGADILVPSNVNVKIKSTSIFGGAEDERKIHEAGPDAKTIYINAVCIFGGVDVK